MIIKALVKGDTAAVLAWLETFSNGAACSKAKKNPKSGGKLDAGVDYGKMKVQRLRAILSVHGIPCKLCAEKSDFVRAIREAIPQATGEVVCKLFPFVIPMRLGI